MTTSKTLSKLALMTVAVATLGLTGCSMIGLGIGARADASSKPKPKAVPVRQAMTVAPGTQMTIRLKDGRVVSGKYSGLDRIPAEQYATIYCQAREQKPEGILLPALGDSIYIGKNVEIAVGGLCKSYEKKLEGTFEGFERDRILFKQKGSPRLSDVHLSSVTIVSNRNELISRETIERLILEGKIPVLSAIAVESEVGKTLVAMDNVSQIEIPGKKQHYGALTGFLFGAAIDAVVIYHAVQFFKEDWFSFEFRMM